MSIPLKERYLNTKLNKMFDFPATTMGSPLFHVKHSLYFYDWEADKRMTSDFYSVKVKSLPGTFNYLRPKLFDFRAVAMGCRLFHVKHNYSLCDLERLKYLSNYILEAIKYKHKNLFKQEQQNGF